MISNKTNVAVAVNRAIVFSNEVQERWMLYFDGNMWIETPELALEAGDRIRLQWQGRMPAWGAWISFSDRQYEIRHNFSTKSIETRPAVDVYLNGSEIDSNATPLPDANQLHTFEMVVGIAMTTRLIVGGIDRDPVTPCGVGYFLNLEVVGKHKYLINEGGGDIAHNLLEPNFPELIPDGEFDAEGDWSVQSGWTIENGKAVCNTTSGSKNINYSVAFDSDKAYLVKINVAKSISGQLRLLAYAEGFQTSIVEIDEEGETELILIFGTSTGSSKLRLLVQAYNGWVGEIESISVKETTHAQIRNAQPSSWEMKKV